MMIEDRTASALLGVLQELSRTSWAEFDLSDVLVGVCVDCTGLTGVSGVAVHQAAAPDKTAFSGSDVGEFVAMQRQMRADPTSAPPEQNPYFFDPTTVLEKEALARLARKLDFRSCTLIAIEQGTHLMGWLQAFCYGPGNPSSTTLDALHSVAGALATTMRNVQLHREMTGLTVQLSQALQSRVPIEQAKGILAERKGVSVNQAFGVLRAHARRNRISLRNAADAVLAGASLETSMDVPVRHLTATANPTNQQKHIARIRKRA